MFRGYVPDLRGCLLPAVRNRSALILVRLFPRFIDFGKGNIHDLDPHLPLDVGSDSGPATADRQDLGLLHPPQTLVRGTDLQFVGEYGGILRLRGPLAADAGRRRHEIRRRPSLLDERKTLHRVRHVLDARGGDKAHVGCLRAEKARRVHQEATASSVLEVGIEHGFAGGREFLHDPIPAIQLVHDVAVNRGRLVRRKNLLCLFRTRSLRRDKLHVRAAPSKLLADAVHDGDEIKADVRPVRTGLLRGMQRVDKANPRLAGALGCANRAFRHQQSRRTRARRASGRQEPPPIHRTTRTSGNDIHRVHSSALGGVAKSQVNDPKLPMINIRAQRYRRYQSSVRVAHILDAAMSHSKSWGLPMTLRSPTMNRLGNAACCVSLGLASLVGMGFAPRITWGQEPPAAVPSAANSFGLSETECRKIEEALPERAQVVPAKPRRLLIFDRNVNYGGHGSIPYANLAFTRMGRKTGAFETVVSRDPAVF